MMHNNNDWTILYTRNWFGKIGHRFGRKARLRRIWYFVEAYLLILVMPPSTVALGVTDVTRHLFEPICARPKWAPWARNHSKGQPSSGNENAASHMGPTPRQAERRQDLWTNQIHGFCIGLNPRSWVDMLTSWHKLVFGLRLSPFSQAFLPPIKNYGLRLLSSP